MDKLKKGSLTQKFILDTSRKALNEKGINLSIMVLSEELGVNKSKITNHFPTKDTLFLALMADYEEVLSSLLLELREISQFNNFQGYVNSISRIMDVQFDYRCVIIYLNVLSPMQGELKTQLQQNYARNLASIKIRVKNMIDQGLLKKDILSPLNWKGFVFVYTNLLTQWVIQLDMYNSADGYKKMKPVYLRGIMNHSYFPFLTTKGKAVFDKLQYS